MNCFSEQREKNEDVSLARQGDDSGDTVTAVLAGPFNRPGTDRDTLTGEYNLQGKGKEFLFGGRQSKVVPASFKATGQLRRETFL